jgi:hypothetical protein
LLVIDNATATVSGNTVTLDAPAQIIEGSTYLPLRFIGENLGLEVEWLGDPPTAIMRSANSPLTLEQMNDIALGITPPTVAAPPITATQPTPQVEEPAPLHASYQQILDTYTVKLQEATPRLLDEFRAAAVGVTDITRLAEISVDITAALAEISVEGTVEMANLWIVRGVGTEAVYMDYAARLNNVYMEEAAHISALYLERAARL